MSLHAYHEQDGRYRYMVLASNQKQAAAALGTTVNLIRNYGGRYPDGGPEHQLALKLPPGTIFRKDVNPHPLAQWLINRNGEYLNR